MRHRVLMPAFDPERHPATLVAWLVRPGQAVAAGDALATIEADKSILELECYVTGTVARLWVSAGTLAPPFTLLAEIESPEPTR